MNAFLQRLHDAPLLVDGAMGTLLYALGASPEHCLEQLVVDRPGWVAGIHQAYATAGADLITSHTFGANRLRLAHYGLQERVREFNLNAVRLVRDLRQATGQAFFVAGNVGPVGKHVAWHDAAEAAVVAEAFGEQISALAEADAELLLFETFSDLRELEVAVLTAKSLCELPLVACMSYSSEGLTLAGQDAGTVTARLLALGVDVVGANCSVGPMQMVETLRTMQKAAPDGTFCVMPNAGLPERIAGQFHYPAGPEEFAGYLPQFLEWGARLVGGCCGSTPEHIQAMRRVMELESKRTV